MGGNNTDIPHEVRIMKDIGRHENILRCFRVLQSVTKLGFKEIVLEYCDLGDLHRYAEYRLITENFIWRAMEQISKGLNHLHSLGIVHGDLKMANVLVRSSMDHGVPPTFKIADFGASKINHPVNIPRGHHGTWIYSSPESVFRFGPAQDMWAFGVIVHMLCHKKWPLRKFRKIHRHHNDWSSHHKFEIPEHTLKPDSYKKFRKWLAENRLETRPAEKASAFNSMPRSRLLGHFMMRCLDENWKTRIKASELYHFVPTLKTFVKRCNQIDITPILNLFDDRKRTGELVTDSNIVSQVFCALFDEAKCRSSSRAGRWVDMAHDMGAPLLTLLDEEDFAKAKQHAGLDN